MTIDTTTSPAAKIRNGADVHVGLFVVRRCVCGGRSVLGHVQCAVPGLGC